MKKEKIKGISEAMFGEIKLSLEEFKCLNSDEFTELIDNYLLENSNTYFFIRDLNEVTIAGKKLKVKSEETDFLKVSDEELHLVFWEQLDEQNIELEEYNGDIKLMKTSGRRYPFFETEEISGFSDYEFLENENKVDTYLNTESFGQIETKQVYIYDSALNEYNIDLLNDDVEEELEAIKEMIS